MSIPHYTSSGKQKVRSDQSSLRFRVGDCHKQLSPYTSEEKRTRPISCHLDRTADLVN